MAKVIQFMAKVIQIGSMKYMPKVIQNLCSKWSLHPCRTAQVMLSIAQEAKQTETVKCEPQRRAWPRPSQQKRRDRCVSFVDRYGRTYCNILINWNTSKLHIQHNWLYCNSNAQNTPYVNVIHCTIHCLFTRVLYLLYNEIPRCLTNVAVYYSFACWLHF